MKKIIPLLPAILISFYAALLSADGGKQITLKDGSIIHGRIVAVDNGKYVIQSPSVGQIRISEDDVTSITASGEEAPGHSPRAQTQPDYTGQVQRLQGDIMANPRMMTDLQALANDPQVAAMLKDPAFLSAVQSQDIAALQKSPHMQELMNNPRVKALIQQLR